MQIYAVIILKNLKIILITKKKECKFAFYLCCFTTTSYSLTGAVKTGERKSAFTLVSHGNMKHELTRSQNMVLYQSPQPAKTNWLDQGFGEQPGPRRKGRRSKVVTAVLCVSNSIIYYRIELLYFKNSNIIK